MRKATLDLTSQTIFPTYKYAYKNIMMLPVCLSFFAEKRNRPVINELAKFFEKRHLQILFMNTTH